MRGGVVPPALLFVALGLALAFARRSAWIPSLLTLFATLGAFTFLPVPQVWLEGVFLGCWISVIATAAMLFEPSLVAKLVTPAAVVMVAQLPITVAPTLMLFVADGEAGCVNERVD